MQPPDINKTEKKQIEAKGFKDFLERPDQTGIMWIRRKQDDSCFFLKNNQCTIYEVRPAVCRLEPFTIVDYDYAENRIELELNFPFSSCCVGTCEETETLPLEEIAKAAQILVQKILDLTAEDLNLPVKDKRVHAETRSRLLRRCVEAANLQV
jgi:Fe-S-cluster containining protein